MRLVRFLKWAWVLVNLVGMQFVMSACANEYACFSAQERLLSLSLLVGFPGSLLAMLTVVAVFGSIPSDFPVLFTAGFIGGFVQWFFLAPRLLKVYNKLTLRRSQRRTVAPLSIIAEPVGVPELPRKKPTLRTSLIRQFDASGRTPLERALAADKRG